MQDETRNLPASPGERWLSVEEITAHLGVARDTIYRWIDQKSLPAHRLGKLWKFKISEVDDWVRSGGADEPRPRWPSCEQGSARPEMMAERRGHGSTHAGSWLYTSRLQKGGALLEDMRQLVRTWSDAPVAAQRDSGVRSNILNKGTRTRLADVYQRAFLPRFVSGPIPEAWKLVRPLEDVGAPIHIVRPVYYWISAKAEPLLGDFCREFILPRHASVHGGIGTEDVVDWMAGKGCPWSEAAAIRVARGLLAALRDFGILEGRARKRLANNALPMPAFAYLALCLRLQGAASRSLLTHEDWQLHLLSPGDVEHLFLMAHQEKLLEYHAAGSTISINFPTESLEEYAHVVTQRPL